MLKLGFGQTNLVFLSNLTHLPSLVLASVFLTLCCFNSNRRRAFSSRMGAFISSSSFGSGSSRGPSAPGGEPSAAAEGLAVGKAVAGEAWDPLMVGEVLITPSRRGGGIKGWRGRGRDRYQPVVELVYDREDNNIHSREA